MRVAVRILCWASLFLAALACERAAEHAAAKPCLPADAAAGRCQPPPAKPFVLPPGAVLPDWALALCKDWRRADGSCDQIQIMVDYDECLREEGGPEQQRLKEQGVGNRAINRGRDRATNLCLELRHWIMTEEGVKRWQGS